MKPYHPASGTEGMRFQDFYCVRCKRDDEFSEDHPERGCQILAASYAGPVPEWVYGEDWKPTCTAFDGSNT